MCQYHTKKTPLKKTKQPLQRKKLKSERIFKFYSSPEGIKSLDRAMQSHLRHEMFIRIWNKRKHMSEVSGQKLYGEPLSIYFHHILPKAKFPMADLDEDNIIILTFEEHDMVEKDMFIFEEVNVRREQLLKKYNLI